MIKLHYLLFMITLVNYSKSINITSYTYQNYIYSYNSIIKYPLIFNNIIPLSANCSRLTITINNLGVSMFQQKFIYDIARALFIDPSRIRINSIKPLGVNAPGIVRIYL